MQKMIQNVFKKPDRQTITKLSMLALSLLLSALILLNKALFIKLSAYGYIGIFFISIIGNATVAIPAPVFLTALIGGEIFNPYVVGIVSAAGATIGELTGYMAGYGGKAFIAESKRYKKIEEWLKKRGFLTLFILATIPNPLFDIAGICAGIMNYPLKKFLLATFLGKTIKFTFIALIGAHALN